MESLWNISLYRKLCKILIKFIFIQTIYWKITIIYDKVLNYKKFMWNSEKNFNY